MTGHTEAFEHCVVLGGGSWGTALAALLARKSGRTSLWTRNEDVARSINEDRENRAYLPGVELPDTLMATSDKAILAEADAALCVIPAQYVREQIPTLRDIVGERVLPVAVCAKGIEQSTGLMMHEVLGDVWPEAKVSVLSGPSFAIDVAQGLPAAVTLADPDPETGEKWIATMATPTFRPYLSDDVVGAEIGGAVKNVLAIACGVVEGRSLGESAKAALMTRGFAEASRFAEAMGGKSETLHGLSGLGDLILTCSSRQSRNMSLGYEMGKGRSMRSIMAERNTVAEGAATAPILLSLAEKKGVDMPIVRAVNALLTEEFPIDQVIDQLLNRPLKKEGA